MDESTIEAVPAESPEPAPKPKPKACRINGCDEPGKNKATGYCVEHYRRHMNAKRAGAI